MSHTDRSPVKTRSQFMAKAKLRTVILAAFLLFSCAREEMEIGGSPAAGLDAAQLLGRAMQRYETATRYRDAGTIRTRSGGHEFSYSFTTQFTEPARLDLVMTKKGRKPYAIHLDQQSPEERSLLLFGGTGVTNGTSMMVPPLLVATTTPSPLTRLTNAVVGGTETVNGERCARIEGQDQEGNPFVVWIGEESQVIRRTLRSVSAGVPQPYETQLDYEIVSLD